MDLPPGPLSSYNYGETYIGLLHCIKQWVDLYLGLLSYCALSTEEMTQQVVDTRAVNPLLLPDLTTEHGPTVDVQQRHELGETVHHAALAQTLGIATELDARADEGEEAYRVWGRD